MLILGLNSHEINSSAAVIKDNKFIYGAPEERFSRNKLTKKFPKSAINFFIDNYTTNFSKFDYIGQSWNPSAYFRKYNPILSDERKLREEYFYTIPDNIFEIIGQNRKNFSSNNDYTKISFNKESLAPKFFFINHHICHASNSFFTSSFDNAAILTCDFKGEFETTTFSIGKNNKIKKFKSIEMPNSLGMLYATLTQLLGYKPDQDEWKVMAISAFKNRDKTFFNKIKKLYRLENDGNVVFNLEYFRGDDLLNPNLFTENLMKLFGNVNPNTRKKKISDWHISVASALQMASEEIATHFLNYLYNTTKQKNVVLGGGFFMNSVFNGKVLDNTKFKNIHIPYSPTDCGNSIGAALYIHHCILNKKRIYQEFNSEIGPKFSNDKIIKLLKKRKIKFYISKNIENEICELILKFGYLAHFDHESEFGDRALGNRSILGDPRFKKIKNDINSAIKYREEYRPFAPMVLSEKVNKFFEVDSKFESKHMEKVVKVKNQYRTKLEAVTHVDGSARVQTIKKSQLKIYKILSNFENKTGLPILLNTSFNINAEPMVLTPEDAINTFYKSGLEVLVMSNIVVKK